MGIRLIYLLLLHHTVAVSGQAYYTKIIQHGTGNTCQTLEDTFLPNYRGLVSTASKGVKVKVSPVVKLPEEGEQLGVDGLKMSSDLIEIYGQTKKVLKETVKSFCNSGNYPNGAPTYDGGRTKRFLNGTNGTVPEIRKIVDSGDPSNRIDVVFMGDGYDASEREKFFQDIDRFVQEMFEGVTLRSYLPLFNIWAIYVESKESGISYDGPKDTPFKLYREKGQFRVIYPGNADYAREVCKMTGVNACDFPSLIANDDYYGGLGGEFVIFTRSHQTGILLLRHESGHNFLDAGDEYDNADGYYEVNTAESVNNVGWSHWLSGEKREERTMWRNLSYPWCRFDGGSC